MSTWILLLRGINVGGRNRLSMTELAQDLESLGLDGVQTYIQSGNVVFRGPDVISSDLEEDIAATIEERHGFRPHVFMLSPIQLEEAMESNPFPEAEAEPSRLHLYFLESTPEDPDMESLQDVKKPSERFALVDQAFYLHAPDGIGRSKLAAKVGRVLGVPVTARNWRTVKKLREMVGAA